MWQIYIIISWLINPLEHTHQSLNKQQAGKHSIRRCANTFDWRIHKQRGLKVVLLWEKRFGAYLARLEDLQEGWKGSCRLRLASLKVRLHNDQTEYHAPFDALVQSFLHCVIDEASGIVGIVSLSSGICVYVHTHFFSIVLHDTRFNMCVL